ncbi:hypothetical protein IAU59_005402 [Kwoniella sp. CBS 9459]
MAGTSASISMSPDMVIVTCKWDFCTDTFVTFAEWETHFAIEHVAYARPIDLTGRRQRMTDDGYWELMDEELGPIDHLLLHEDPSQTTGDITTTTHTLSLPLPPSLQSVNSPVMSYPIDMLIPPQTPGDFLNSPQAREEEERLHLAARDAENQRLYQSFLRSPSLSPVQSGSGSISNSCQPPPPGQPCPSPSWSPTHPQPPSQPFATPPISQDTDPSSSHDASPPASFLSDVFSIELPRSADSPFGPSGHRSLIPSDSTSHHSNIPSRSPPNPLKAAQTTLMEMVQPFRFGSALSHADKGSPHTRHDRHVPPSSAAVGFSWGGG